MPDILEEVLTMRLQDIGFGEEVGRHLAMPSCANARSRGARLVTGPEAVVVAPSCGTGDGLAIEVS